MKNWLFNCLKPHRLSLAFGVLLILLHSLFTWLLIPLSKELAPLLSQFQLEGFSLILLQIFGLYFLKSLLQTGQAYLWENLALKIICDYRENLYNALLSTSFPQFLTYNKGDLITRFGDDFEKLQRALVACLSYLIPQSFMLLLLSLTLIWLNWPLCLAALILVPLLFFCLNRFQHLIFQTSFKLQTQFAKLQDEIQESLTHLLSLRLFRQKYAQLQRFQTQQAQYKSAYLHQLIPLVLQAPLLGFFQVVAIGLLLLLGGWQVSQGWIQGADLLAFGTTLALSIDPVLQLTQALQELQKSQASWERLNQLNTSDPVSESPPTPGEFKGLTLDQLSFAYPQHPNLLENLELSIQPGDQIGLIGPSGSGKSTLLALMGEILQAENPNMLRFSGQAPWGRIILPQTPALFNRSLRENICLDQELSTTQLQTLIQVCQLENLLQKLPQGWDTPLGGWNLSGGEKQRICLARALAFQPEFLILDESTSELDLATEKQIYQTLQKNFPNLTLLVISHRPETLETLDQIYRLEQKRLIPLASPFKSQNLSWYAKTQEE